MSILEKNLTAGPKLKDIFSYYHDDLYPVEEAKKEGLTLKLNGVYLHSKYDPSKEAERIVNFLLQDKDELDIIVLYGSGLGYVARDLYKNFLRNNNSATRPFIVYIEKDPRIFLTSLQHFDWSEILNDEYFKFFLDADKKIIGTFIQSIPTKRIRYYYHRPSYVFNIEYYKEIQNYITYVLDRKDMNAATFSRFQRLWTKNFIYNLPSYLHSNPVNALRNTGEDATAILVAGGPTLEKCIDYLKAVKDNSIIIAVDTVYKYLKKHSIIPDIIVTADPQFWNFKYLENEKVTDSIIITDSSVYHKIFQLTDSKNLFIGSSIFSIAGYFEENNKERGTLLAGGSVSTTAFDAARIIGCKDIVLIGLDLSFPGRQTHFKGAFFETNFLTFTEYFRTAEQASYEYLTHASLKVAESTNGSVFTDPKMILFKKWFDREIPLTTSKVIQPNLGGILLEGSNIVELGNLPIPEKNSKEGFKDKLSRIQSTGSKINPEDISIKIERVMKESSEIKKICKKIVELIPQDGKVKENNKQKIYSLENELFNDKEREKIASIISASAQDVLISIIENEKYSNDEQESAWIKSKILYNSIIDLSNFFEKCFKKTLKLDQNRPNI